MLQAKVLKIEALLTETYLSQLAIADSEGIGIIFTLSTQLISTMSLPDNMANDKRVASTAFAKRAADRGDYLQAFVASGGFENPGKLMESIGQHGCYRLKFQDGFLAEVAHITSLTCIVPSHLKTMQVPGSPAMPANVRVEVVSKASQGLAQYVLVIKAGTMKG